jgi:hypothetical protein
MADPEVIRSAFNDAVREGYPVLLRARAEPDEEAIPYVPSLPLPGNDGMYVLVRDQKTEYAFVASRYEEIRPLARLANVRVLDSAGHEKMTSLAHDLTGSRIEFDVRGAPRDDLYRVEVLSDPDIECRDIEEIYVGRHQKPVQSMRSTLRGAARRSFTIDIYRVTRSAYQAEPDSEGLREWSKTFTVG